MFSLLLAQLLQIISVQQLRGFQIYPSWQRGEACKKPLTKAQIWNTLCIQDTNWFFCLRERLTKETDFVRVRLSPYGFILEFRPSSHFRTVNFTKWPARSAGCHIMSPTICKLNSIFRRQNKLTRKFVPPFGCLESRSLLHFHSPLLASLVHFSQTSSPRVQIYRHFAQDQVTQKVTSE